MSDTLIACDPLNNVVVEACAGSGKTWLLTTRMFRLLLAGAKPSEILAITFTRKAAMEMRERLAGLLTECALCSQGQLEEFLRIRGVQPSEAICEKARLLAGLVLTDSRGVTIDTFHGWFTSLCQMAPLGSGFSRQAEPTDHVEFWRSLACEQFVAQVSQSEEPGSLVRSSMDLLANQLGHDGLFTLLNRSLNNWVSAQLWLQEPESETLAQVFEINESEQWPQEVFQNKALIDRLQTMARWLGVGTASQQKQANQLESYITDMLSGSVSLGVSFELIWGFFFTKAGTPSRFKLTKDQIGSTGLTQDSYEEHSKLITDALSYARAMAFDVRDFERSQALQILLPPLISQYQALKTEQGLCDFDDLELTAYRLLRDENQSAYMQQKLDQRIRHILVDEFQDTNPVQWSILRHWLEGYGSDGRPSVFLVGDPKQSIYRFRRAESRLFEYAKNWLVTHYDAKVILSDSTRRCCPEVIEVINRVMIEGDRMGQTPFRTHGSSNPDIQPDGHAGLLLYPVVAYEPEEGVNEAKLMVSALQAMKAKGEIEHYGQMLVLVRSHANAAKLVPELRLAGIAHQLKDRGERYDSLIWSDTQALFGWLESPEDNFSLLQLLRSPLMGVSSEQFQALIKHANQTGFQDAWLTLQDLAGVAAWAKSLVTLLNDWLDCASRLPLFELVSLVADSTQASVRYLNASEPTERILFAEHWDWLKGWALTVNKGRFPTLRKAIDEAARLAQYAASDGEGEASSRDVLQVLTVHSAKGLEADHVWLFDASREPRPSGSSIDLLFDWPLGEDEPASLTVIDKDSLNSPSRQNALETEKNARLDEEDHLLYVALTRARRQVHVSGTLDRHGRVRGWYERLLRYQSPLEFWPEAQSLKESARVSEWIRPGYPLLQPLEQPVGEITPRLDSPELRMGTALHALLECVDQFEPGEFESFWLARQLDCEADLSVLDDQEVQEVKGTAKHLLELPHLQDWLLNAPIVFNELEWVSDSGQLMRADRVVKTSEGWFVLDYKWAVNEANLSKYSEQVRQYMRLLELTLAGQEGKDSIKGALIDREGKVHEVSWV